MLTGAVVPNAENSSVEVREPPIRDFDLSWSFQYSSSFDVTRRI